MQQICAAANLSENVLIDFLRAMWHTASEINNAHCVSITRMYSELWISFITSHFFCLFSDSCTDILIPLVQNYCQKVLETKNDEEMLTVSKNIGKLCYGLASKIQNMDFSITFLLPVSNNWRVYEKRTLMNDCIEPRTLNFLIKIAQFFMRKWFIRK